MDLARRHRIGGWWGLVAFVSLGLVLDGLLAFKIDGYMDPGASVRRELWTLAHAHGTVLSLVHVAFASFLSHRPAFGTAALASLTLFVALALMPLGFFLGGLSPAEGDPAFGIWLVPLGGVSLLGGCILVALEASRT